jgi:hypothetical protein
MNTGRTVFSRLIEYARNKEFQKCHSQRRRSSWQKLLLLGSVACPGSMQGKLHHKTKF